MRGKFGQTEVQQFQIPLSSEDYIIRFDVTVYVVELQDQDYKPQSKPTPVQHKKHGDRVALIASQYLVNFSYSEN